MASEFTAPRHGGLEELEMQQTDPMCFRLPALRGITFVRRPVADAPKERTICLVDDGHAAGWSRRPVPALFHQGAWTTDRGRPLPFEPTHWVEIRKPLR
jgi:hypothetical protein